MRSSAEQPSEKACLLAPFDVLDRAVLLGVLDGVGPSGRRLIGAGSVWDRSADDRAAAGLAAHHQLAADALGALPHADDAVVAAFLGGGHLLRVEPFAVLFRRRDDLGLG